MIAATSLLSSSASLSSSFARPRTPNPNPNRKSQPARAPTVRAAAVCAPPASPVTTSLYDVLGLPAEASVPEIKAAYRRMARSCHPDVVAVERKETSADLFMQVHAAYSTLSDPNKRAEYDRQLLVLRRCRRSTPFSSHSASSSSYSVFRRRTWETDQCW